MLFRRRLFHIAASLLLCGSVAYGGESNAKCPLMTEEDIDAENTVEYEGIKVRFCCRSCVKIWNRDPLYVIKASAALLPQFAGMEARLGLEKITLLEQRHCPVRRTHLVTPDSPSVEYKGVKIYLWDDESKALWEKDADGCARRALEAGLLPQLAAKLNPKKNPAPEKKP